MSKITLQSPHLRSSIEKSIGEIWYDEGGNECYYRPNGSISCTTVNNDPSLTIQSEKDSCDFNLIYAKYVKTGQMTNIRRDSPLWGDFSQITDYHGAVMLAEKADEAFLQLPAAVRARFSNDPGELIDFLNDSNNRAEAIKLGLIEVPVVPDAELGNTPPPSAEGG